MWRKAPQLKYIGLPIPFFFKSKFNFSQTVGEIVFVSFEVEKMRMFLVQSIVHWYWILARSWDAVVSFTMWNYWLKDGSNGGNGRLSWTYRPWRRFVALGVIGASIRCKQSGHEAKSTILHTLWTGFEVNADSYHAELYGLVLKSTRTIIMLNGCCCVYGCSNWSGHSFPKDTFLRKQWQIAVRRENLMPTGSSIVCKIHFLQSDYHVSEYM